MSILRTLKHCDDHVYFGSFNHTPVLKCLLNNDTAEDKKDES